MSTEPVNLTEALASFTEIYSPRIVARVNNYDVRVAHTRGEHVCHVHEDTDEFFLVLAGQFDVSLREPGGTVRTVTLRQGDTFVVHRGTRAQAVTTPAHAYRLYAAQRAQTLRDARWVCAGVSGGG